MAMTSLTILKAEDVQQWSEHVVDLTLAKLKIYEIVPCSLDSVRRLQFI